MITIKESLSSGTRKIEKMSLSARLDAEILLAYVLNKERAFLYAYPEFLLNLKQQEAFQSLIEQRKTYVPIAYLIKKRDFWSMYLDVSEATLIPRPETELLVEISLKLLENTPCAQILDLGTGSGAIALACAKEQPDWKIFASDYSSDALTIAKQNAKALNLNVHFFHSDWFIGLEAEYTFDAILTNPPYIDPEMFHIIDKEVHFEPKMALDGGKNGLEIIEHIISNSIARLKPEGLLLIEHGFEQKSAVRSMLMNYGYDWIQCWQDWQGQDRVSGGRLKRA